MLKFEVNRSDITFSRNPKHKHKLIILAHLLPVFFDCHVIQPCQLWEEAVSDYFDLQSPDDAAMFKWAMEGSP